MYVDSNSLIDKEALRNYVCQELERMAQLASKFLHDDRYSSFWINLHNSIANRSDKEKQVLLMVESQLTGLPVFIDKWIETAVESSERFEFFITTKAEEIKSGDQQKDYFWALQIRHDQLVALVRVLGKLLEHFQIWTNKPVDEVMEDGVFRGLTDYSIEDQIFIEAEAIHKARERVM